MSALLLAQQKISKDTIPHVLTMTAGNLTQKRQAYPDAAHTEECLVLPSKACVAVGLCSFSMGLSLDSESFSAASKADPQDRPNIVERTVEARKLEYDHPPTPKPRA